MPLQERAPAFFCEVEVAFFCEVEVAFFCEVEVAFFCAAGAETNVCQE